PEPVSPISASTSPGAREKLMSSTITVSFSSCLDLAVTLSPETLSGKPMWDMDLFSSITFGRQGINKKVCAHGQCSNADCWRDNGYGTQRQARNIFMHHGPQVGHWRLHAQAEKSHRAQQNHDENESQSHVGENGPKDVR